MARPDRTHHQIATRLSHAELDQLDELAARLVSGTGRKADRASTVRAAIATLAVLREPLDESDVANAETLAGRFGVTPATVVSVLLDDTNAQAIVSRNLRHRALTS
jgi:hypothetical protein